MFCAGEHGNHFPPGLSGGSNADNFAKPLDATGFIESVGAIRWDGVNGPGVLITFDFDHPASKIARHPPRMCSSSGMGPTSLRSYSMPNTASRIAWSCARPELRAKPHATAPASSGAVPCPPGPTHPSASAPSWKFGPAPGRLARSCNSICPDARNRVGTVARERGRCTGSTLTMYRFDADHRSGAAARHGLVGHGRVVAGLGAAPRRAGGTGGTYLVEVDADDGAVINVHEAPDLDRILGWSPTGERVAWSTFGTRSARTLWSMRVDGSDALTARGRRLLGRYRLVPERSGAALYDRLPAAIRSHACTHGLDRWRRRGGSSGRSRPTASRTSPGWRGRACLASRGSGPEVPSRRPDG